MVDDQCKVHHSVTMGYVPCQGLPTKGDSRVLFTCEKGYVATPDA